jgi:hypothetical protein
MRPAQNKPRTFEEQEYNIMKIVQFVNLLAFYGNIVTILVLASLSKHYLTKYVNFVPLLSLVWIWYYLALEN